LEFCASLRATAPLHIIALAGEMEARDFASKSHSLRHRCRQLKAFFCELQNEFPWWVSLHESVNGEMQTCLTHFLGFQHSVGVEFLCTIGLLKVGNSRNPHSTVVVPSEWEKFIIEEQISEIVETINRTAFCWETILLYSYRKKRELATLSDRSI
jgi:hypothetical protein